MKDYNYEQANADREARCRQAKIEMDAYFETLPATLSDDEKFVLWASTDAERAEFLAAYEAPKPIAEKLQKRNRQTSAIDSFNNAPYLHTRTEKKAERVGSIRI